jgi:ABC-type transport system involved in multi-copper enzyme maturation permease subunit
VLTAIFGAIVTGVGLSEDLTKGIVDRLRSLPIARSAVLVGRTLSDLARNAGAVVPMVAVGIVVGFKPTHSIRGATRRPRAGTHTEITPAATR